MIVVAIIGILASIALPSYTRYVVQARRTEAQTVLMELAQRQERWRVNHASYTSNLAGDLGFTNTLAYYDFAATASTTGYTLTATATGTQASSEDSNCVTMTLDQNGGKGDPTTKATCWKK
ncbi:MAG: type IV pilin protein [Aquaspirillum sp.]